MGVNNFGVVQMNKLTFKNDKENTLKQMMEWSNNRPRRLPYTKDYTDELGLWLVKDEGIYLMSPSDESFVASDGVVNTVVYAQGYKPTKANHDTLWDKTYSVSPDDFAEWIPFSKKQVEAIGQGHSIVLRLTKDSIQIGV